MWEGGKDISVNITLTQLKQMKVLKPNGTSKDAYMEALVAFLLPGYPYQDPYSRDGSAEAVAVRPLLMWPMRPMLSDTLPATLGGLGTISTG